MKEDNFVEMMKISSNLTNATSVERIRCLRIIWDTYLEFPDLQIRQEEYTLMKYVRTVRKRIQEDKE